MPITVPHQTITSYLRASGIAGPTWSTTGSPYYKRAPVPLPVSPFPFVIFNVQTGSVAHTFNGSYVYNETFDVEITVVGIESDVIQLGSPYDSSTTSVVAYMDALANQPFLLNGDTFQCDNFIRKHWELSNESEHAGPAGDWVWEVRALYSMMVTANYPGGPS